MEKGCWALREGAGKPGEVQENTRNQERGKLWEMPGSDTRLAAFPEFPTQSQPEDGPVLQGALGVRNAQPVRSHLRKTRLKF